MSGQSEAACAKSGDTAYARASELDSCQKSACKTVDHIVALPSRRFAYRLLLIVHLFLGCWPVQQDIDAALCTGLDRVSGKTCSKTHVLLPVQ